MPSTGYTQISMTVYDGIQTEMNGVITNYELGSNVCIDKCARSFGWLTNGGFSGYDNWMGVDLLDDEEKRS